MKAKVSGEPISSIEDVLFYAKVAAFEKVYMPDGIKNKYRFVINEETKQCTVESKQK